jgi:hypothetical protein
MLGAISVSHHSVALNTTDNETFVSVYGNKFGEAPAFYSECGYTNMSGNLDPLILSLGSQVIR